MSGRFQIRVLSPANRSDFSFLNGLLGSYLSLFPRKYIRQTDPCPSTLLPLQMLVLLHLYFFLSVNTCKTRKSLLDLSKTKCLRLVEAN